MYTYYQGETLRIDIQSPTIDFDSADFALLLYRYATSPYGIAKATMTRIDAHHYLAEVPSAATATWATGDYTAEVVLLRDLQKVSIGKSSSFSLENTSSKGKLWKA